MIPKQQLRHGNLVKDRGGKTIVIDWFEKDKVCQKMMLESMEVHTLTEYFDYLHPIEITEEMLVNNLGCTELGNVVYKDKNAFGFGKDGNLIWCNGELYRPLYGGGFMQITYPHDWPVGNPCCESLHQLQNLYYDMYHAQLIITGINTA